MKRFVTLLATLLLALGAGGAVAQQPPPPRAGTITFHTKAIGFILGVEWGSGEFVAANGRRYPLRIRTVKAGMAGLEAVSAAGNVYHLNPRRPQDIAGTYTSVGAGITIGGGVGGQQMRNEKGVVIVINETAQGIAAKIAASGIAIELQ